MGRIHFLIIGNSFHSDVPRDRWRQFDGEGAGIIEAIGQSGVPVSMSWQGVDFGIYPWLKKALTRQPSIEVLKTPFSHALLPFTSTKHRRWQSKKAGESSTHPVGFHAEFYAPEAHFIASEAFLILGSQTVAYSVGSPDELGQPSASPLVCMGDDPEKHAAILHGGKIGIVLRNFEPILKAFFYFQRELTEDSLNGFLSVLEDIASSSDGVTIMPIDIEAPYVGSLGGAEVWRRVFNGISQRGLQNIFVSLSDVLGELRPRAVPSKRPHRVVGSKWTAYEVQIRYLAQILNIVPRTEREQYVLAIAGTSDVLSGLFRELGKKPISFSVKDFDGGKHDLALTYNPDIIEVGHAALRALQDSTSFREKLQDLPKEHLDSLFVRRVMDFAEKLDL